MGIFKDIPNYSGYYQVSDEGIVTSVQRLVQMKNGKSKLMPAKIIKPDIKNGYYSVCFSKDNIKKSFRVNRLVAAVFHGLDLNDITQKACHIDDNPFNNRADNIFVGTQSDNIKDMHRKGRWQDRKGEKHPCAKYTEEQIKRIKKYIIEGYSNIDIETLTGVARGQVANIKGNRIWKWETIK